MKSASAKTVKFTTPPSPVSVEPTAAEIEGLQHDFSEALHWASRRALEVNPKAAMTEEWTDFVLDWWAGVGSASGFAVDAHPTGRVDWARSWRATRPRSMARRGPVHEWMLDLALTTYPTYDGDYYSEKHTDALVGTERGKLVIALESEWGSAGSARLNRGRVLEDALKLVHVRAGLKVLCFGVTKAAGTTALVEELEHIRRCGHDQATPWLLFPVPWDRHPPAGRLLKAEEHAAVGLRAGTCSLLTAALGNRRPCTASTRGGWSESVSGCLVPRLR